MTPALLAELHLLALEVRLAPTRRPARPTRHQRPRPDAMTPTPSRKATPRADSTPTGNGTPDTSTNDRTTTDEQPRRAGSPPPTHQTTQTDKGGERGHKTPSDGPSRVHCRGGESHTHRAERERVHMKKQTEGERLAAEIREGFELAPHELALLEQAARTLDLCNALQAELDADDSPLADTRAGVRAHPAAVELRQQRITLARLLAALRIPDEDDATRTQRRSVRGVHKLRGVS